MKITMIENIFHIAISIITVAILASHVNLEHWECAVLGGTLTLLLRR